MHNRRSCWERGLKGALAHALKIEFTSQDFERLKTFSMTLPEDTLGEIGTVSNQE